MGEKISKIYARPLPRVYAIFLFAIEYSAKAQHTTTGAREGGRGGATPGARGPVVVCWALADYSMANRKIAYTLGRGRAYISDMSSTSGYMGEKYFQEFGPRFFDMSSASGYMGEKYFRNLVPDFWTCPTAKKGHIYKGGWISVVRRVFTGGVIIMKSRVRIHRTLTTRWIWDLCSTTQSLH